MTRRLENLLEAAKKVVLTPEEKEHQRRSFAYGNTKIENSRITREMVDEAADELNKAKARLQPTFRETPSPAAEADVHYKWL
jgi:hypothetical protein